MLKVIKRKKKEEKEDFFKDNNNLPSKWKMRMRINSLENDKEMLEEIIKSELYKAFMDKLGEPDTIKRLKEENKRLRQKIKSYKEEIKYGNSK